MFGFFLRITSRRSLAFTCVAGVLGAVLLVISLWRTAAEWRKQQAYLREATDYHYDYREWVDACNDGGVFEGNAYREAYVYDPTDAPLRAGARFLGDHLYYYSTEAADCDANYRAFREPHKAPAQGAK